MIQLANINDICHDNIPVIKNEYNSHVNQNLMLNITLTDSLSNFHLI
jgi:hypothetical protein